MVIWVVGILWSTIIGWVAVRNTGMAIIHRRTRSCVTVVPVPAPHPAIGFSIGHYKSGIGTFGIIGRADTVIILSIPIGLPSLQQAYRFKTILQITIYRPLIKTINP
jgi:hypothetical protein